MNNMVNVIDTIAASTGIPAKVKGDKFLQYWYTQMEKDPFLRDVFEMMTEEEMKAQYGPDMEPNTGDEGQEEGEEEKKPPKKEEKQQEQPQEKQEVEEVQKQPTEGADTKEEEIIRNTFQ